MTPSGQAPPLVGGANPARQEATPVSTPRSASTTMERSRVPERDRLQVPIASDLKRALKVAAAKRDQLLWEVIEEAARDWLRREGKKQ